MPPFYVKAFPEYLRAAGYYTANRAKTDYQFGVPFTIWDDVGPNAHWRNRADKNQPFFRCSTSKSLTKAGFFRRARRVRERSSSRIRRDPASAVLPGYPRGP